MGFKEEEILCLYFTYLVNKRFGLIDNSLKWTTTLRFIIIHIKAKPKYLLDLHKVYVLLCIIKESDTSRVS